MLHKTKGIVLKTTDYADNSVIAKIYTSKFGLQSYLINGVKKPKAKIRMNMLQPLHILDLVVYHKPQGNIQRISDAKSDPVLQSIPYHIIKSAMVMFLNEMIYKSLKQQHEDEIMFTFIEKSIELLDKSESNFVNFHLIFLIKLTRFLGFYPELELEKNYPFFDLKDGVFVPHQPPHIYFIEEEYIHAWRNLCSQSIDNFYDLKIDAKTRKYLLSKIIDFYKLHIEDFGTIKSNMILEEVLS
jgi:DNA repair protein RecO (recombination protein O)